MKSKISELELMSRHFKLLPELPNNLDTWVRDNALGYSKYIFRHRVNDELYGYCTHCERDVSLEPLRTESYEESLNRQRKHNEEGFCPNCKSKVVFKDYGRGRSKLFDYNKIIVIQRVGKIIICRYIDVMRSYIHFALYPTKTAYTEEYRVFIDTENNRVYTYYRPFSFGGASYYDKFYGYEPGEAYERDDWRRKSSIHVGKYKYGCAYLYIQPKTVKELCIGTSIQYCKVDDYYNHPGKAFDYFDLVEYMSLSCRYPKAVEYLSKSGFDYIINYTLRYGASGINWRAKTPTALFGVEKSDMKLLSKSSKVIEQIKILKDLQKYTLAPAEKLELLNYDSYYTYEHGYKEILKHTSFKKAKNYLQKVKCKPSDYADYFKDCEKLEFDFTRHEILFPKDLKAAHQRTIELIHAKDTAQRVKDNAKVNTKIKKQYKKLNEMYGFRSNGMFVRPASGVKEIIDEGHSQQICVGDSHQHYIKNHADGIAFIFFIRLESEPDKPFYTVEISNAGSVLQVRGNRNGAPTDAVKAFVAKWKKHMENLELKKSA